MRTKRTPNDMLALLVLVLGAAAMAVLALRTGADDRVTQALSLIALVCLIWATVATFRRQKHARR